MDTNSSLAPGSPLSPVPTPCNSDDLRTEFASKGTVVSPTSKGGESPLSSGTSLSNFMDISGLLETAGLNKDKEWIVKDDDEESITKELTEINRLQLKAISEAAAARKEAEAAHKEAAAANAKSDTILSNQEIHAENATTDRQKHADALLQSHKKGQDANQQNFEAMQHQLTSISKSLSFMAADQMQRKHAAAATAREATQEAILADSTNGGGGILIERGGKAMKKLLKRQTKDTQKKAGKARNENMWMGAKE